jgi:hypothetical protein
MTTQQPDWELVGTIGDVDPLGYGGGFVFRDKTGVYAPEIEYVEPEERHGDVGFSPPDSREAVTSVTVYRVVLEPHTYVNGILSDNPYHPALPVWYADDLDSICESCDCDRDELIAALCGDDPMAKAGAYESLASYWGWHEFDHYALVLTPSEAEERYKAAKYKAETR